MDNQDSPRTSSARPPGGDASVIRVRDLVKVYGRGESRVAALRGVSFDVMRGEMVAVMGASGSGKSTLMNIIGCLDRPTTGSYHLGGEDVSTLTRERLAEIRNRRLGFVFQSFNLLARTSALENVEIPLVYSTGNGRSMRAKAIHCLDLVGLADRAHHHPSQLSGGQQQRVAVARALVNDPDLLLADEPTGNLDTRTSLEIMHVLQDLNAGGMTIVLITHETDIARYAGRTIVLRDGRIVEDCAVPTRHRAADDLRAMPAEVRLPEA
jgi:putative ABC transport system ATP-binding protein